MIYPFDAAFRRLVVRRFAAFTRTPALDTHNLKRAAVAITLVESEDGSGETAFVLIRRGRDLRSHKGQYALPGGRCEEGETRHRGSATRGRGRAWASPQRRRRPGDAR